jgi:hypothetical protein
MSCSNVQQQQLQQQQLQQQQLHSTNRTQAAEAATGKPPQHATRVTTAFVCSACFERGLQTISSNFCLAVVTVQCEQYHQQQAKQPLRHEPQCNSSMWCCVCRLLQYFSLSMLLLLTMPNGFEHGSSAKQQHNAALLVHFS